MSHLDNMECPQAPADVAQSLYWDDLRTGLKLASIGMIVLLVGEIAAQFHMLDFLVGAINIVGALGTLIGFLICTAIPKETGARNWALGAAGFMGVAVVCLLVGLFLSDYPLDIAALWLWAIALVLFALMLRGATGYLGHRPLLAAARSFVSVAVGYGVFLVIVSLLIEYTAIPGLRQLAALVSIGIIGIVVYFAWGTSDAILRCRCGQPLEVTRPGPSPEHLAAEAQSLARENLTFLPPPPPHFSDAQVHYFHADDARAAGTIVVLLAGIFTVGVVLYLIVAWSVWA